MKCKDCQKEMHLQTDLFDQTNQTWVCSCGRKERKLVNKFDPLFSSESAEWETPQDFFNAVNEACQFVLDVCSTPDKAKCKKFYSPQDDGLKLSWDGMCWMNPVYGEPESPCKPKCKKKKCVERGYHINQYVPGIIDWMKKAYRESRKKNTCVVCLVPSRTDTEWFQDYAMNDEDKDNLIFIRGRLKFGGSKNSAPFPSVLVILGDETFGVLKQRIMKSLITKGFRCK